LDILNLILIASILVIVYFLVKMFLNTTKKEAKPVEVKKEEIIRNYENQMRELLNTYKNDDTSLTANKTALLKKISKELSTNIFFDKDEVRSIIQKLVNMH